MIYCIHINLCNNYLPRWIWGYTAFGLENKCREFHETGLYIKLVCRWTLFPVNFMPHWEVKKRQIVNTCRVLTACQIKNLENLNFEVTWPWKLTFAVIRLSQNHKRSIETVTMKQSKFVTLAGLLHVKFWCLGHMILIS